jgi:hypothetical protein
LKLLQNSTEIPQSFRWRRTKERQRRIKRNNRLLKRRPLRASLKITVPSRRLRLGIIRKHFHITGSLKVRCYYI